MKYFVHETAVVDQPCEIGENSKIWHFSHIMKDTRIGSNCVFGQNTFVANNVEIGNGVKIQNNVSVYTGVIIEDNVFIGPSVVFTNVINPRSEIDRKPEIQKTKISYGASIGANATIICGNNIGKYALIGAGTVITKNVEPYALVIGNPMRQIAWVSEQGYRLNFDDRGLATCPGNKDQYILEKSTVRKHERKDTAPHFGAFK